ncbi:hypothetical protein NEOLEDRAFT_381799 [Neolentinus lepideus HHB14362 ss-1]|uniref:Secreted protein n=1 Tax=Neolentinus lepideus HHB14362 ss-1 TaxID=1314782 RepID=A0A165SD37_9AGAM|nr:hypothetical protein NEOLEDRAFT_381799 [Neolentinus lepideus HHB14362 ss-1]
MLEETQDLPWLWLWLWLLSSVTSSALAANGWQPAFTALTDMLRPFVPRQSEVHNALTRSLPPRAKSTAPGNKPCLLPRSLQLDWTRPWFQLTLLLLRDLSNMLPHLYVACAS